MKEKRREIVEKYHIFTFQIKNFSKNILFYPRIHKQWKDLTISFLLHNDFIMIRESKIGNPMRRRGMICYDELCTLFFLPMMKNCPKDILHIHFIPDSFACILSGLFGSFPISKFQYSQRRNNTRYLGYPDYQIKRVTKTQWTKIIPCHFLSCFSSTNPLTKNL